MFLAALLELVPNSQKILSDLSKLKDFLSGVSYLEISLTRIKRNDISVNQLKIDLKEKKQHRTVNELREKLNEYLNEYHYSKPAKDYANNVLNSLITAEAEVHEKLEDKIHLHELSSVDTLIDILGVAKSLDVIGVFKENYEIYCSELPVGSGSISSAHGLIPIPAPATVKILEKSNLIITTGPIKEELSTPTGVALLVNLNPVLKKPSFNLEKMVNSTGQKKFNSFINILRIFKGTKKDNIILDKLQSLKKYNEQVSVIETDIDDISGEIIGDFIEKFTDDNILDIQVIQAITKKNRPSFIIRILTKPEQKLKTIEKLINNLGTLGVRYSTINRICIERDIKKIDIEIDNLKYTLNYKISYYFIGNEKKIINIKPEYNDLKKLSQETGYSVRKLYFLLQSKLYNILE